MSEEWGDGEGTDSQDPSLTQCKMHLDTLINLTDLDIICFPEVFLTFSRILDFCLL